MVLKIVFLGEDESEYIKLLKKYFDKIKNVEISDKSIIKHSDKKNVCFVSEMSSLGLLNSETDISYQAIYQNIQMLLKKKLMTINMYLFKNKIQPEVINNNPYLPVGSSCLLPLENECFMAFSPSITYRRDYINIPKYYYYLVKSVLRIVKNYNMAFNSKIEEVIFPQFNNNLEVIKHMFDAYFDVEFNLDNQANTLKTSTLYFNRAPLKMSYSFLPKKKILQKNRFSNTSQPNNQVKIKNDRLNDSNEPDISVYDRHNRKNLEDTNEVNQGEKNNSLSNLLNI